MIYFRQSTVVAEITIPSLFFLYCLFVSNSQVIGCEDRLQNDLYCVGWGVKLYSVQCFLPVAVALFTVAHSNVRLYLFADDSVVEICRIVSEIG